MQLYLDSYGAFLAMRNGQFAVRTRSAGERLFAVRQVGAILLTRGAGMTTDAALLAVEHDIPVLIIDANTHFPLAQVSAGRPGSIAAIRKNQAVFARAAEGYAWMAGVIAEKIARQRGLLARLAESGGGPDGFAAGRALTDRVMQSLETAFRSWQPPAGGRWDGRAAEAAAGQFRGQEGTVSRLYFQQLALYLGGRMDFGGRQKRPAYDPFNALLNYLYGMLYTQVHLALLKSGLDPYLGILHADQYSRPTLVYDQIEPYRPWADAVALALAAGDQIGEDSFIPSDNGAGLWLSAAGKSAVIDAMLAFLGQGAPYDGRQVKRGVQIDLDAQKLAVRLKDFPE